MAALAALLRIAMSAASKAPLFGPQTVTRRIQSVSRLRDLDEVVDFPPEEHALKAAVLDKLDRVLDGACMTTPGSDANWGHAHRRLAHSSVLRVGVLGCSTTAGCGALAGSAKESKCSAALSWGRRAYDAFVTALHPRTVDMSIYHKNAVEAQFFWDCTRSLLPPSPDVVMIEILQNAYLGIEINLNGTIRALRRTAPKAAIVVIGWPKQGSRNVVEARRLAPELGVDVGDVPHAMRELTLSQQSLYAVVKHKPDHHPNAQGHDLVGNLAAACVAKQLAVAARHHLEQPKAGGGGAEAADQGQQPEPISELCFNSADQIPLVDGGSGGCRRGNHSGGSQSGGGVSHVIHSGSGHGSEGSATGFVLRDYGVAKGVKKFGYTSERIDDNLLVGPLDLPIASQIAAKPSLCHGTLRVRFGYLVSTHPGQGALQLRCAGGCSCRPVKSNFMRAAYPFPTLQANPSLNRGEFRALVVPANESLSVTAYTVFIATMNPTNKATGRHPCRLEVKHVQAGSHTGSGSSVRFDSLAIVPHGGGNDSLLCVQAQRGKGLWRGAGEPG